MYIYLDESGNFASGINTVCSIIIPDTIHDYLKRKFKEFEKIISSEELINGEVKGTNLSYQSRSQFFDFFNQYKEIKITPSAIDLSMQEPHVLDEFFDYALSGYAEAISKTIKNRDDRRRRYLLNILKTYRQDRSLFTHQLMMVHVIHLTLDHMLVHYLDTKYEFCFNRINIIIDRKNPTKLTNYEKLTRDGLPFFCHNLCKERPLGIVTEVWETEHPFRKNFECEDGIDLSKMLSNISFKNSKTEYGLRIADIIANTLYMCLKNDIDYKIYRKMTNNFATGPKVGPNLILMGDDEKNGKMKVPQKYLKFYNY